MEPQKNLNDICKIKGTRIAPPEFYRFFFIFFICFLHLEEDIFDRNHIVANAGYLGVDFFLLLSGFVAGLNHHDSPIRSTFKFIWNRVKKLYPDFLFSVLLMFTLWLCYDNQNGYKGIIEHVWKSKYQFVFANSLYPTNLEMRSIWFLSYWLMGMIVISAVLKRGYLKLVGALAISFMSWHVYNRGSLFNDPITQEYIWSIRLVKCVAEVVIGALAYNAYEYLKEMRFSNLGKLLLSIIEFCSVAFVVFIMSRKGRNMMDYDVLIAFILIIILSFLNKTYLSKLLDNKLSIFLGRMSLPIYLYHLFVVKIAYIYMSATENKLLIYTVVVAGIIVVSIFCHLIVEKLFRPGLECFCKKLLVSEL